MQIFECKIKRYFNYSEKIGQYSVFQGVKDGKKLFRELS
jgi:hypothetical protein